MAVKLSDVEPGAAHIRAASREYGLVVDAKLGLSLMSLSEPVHHLVRVTPVRVPALN